VLTWDPEVAARTFWFVRDYLTDVTTREAKLATLAAAVQGLGPGAKVEVVPVPHDCTDGFFAAHWRRPHAYLDPTVRAGISGLALLPPAIVARAITRLAADLADGTWHTRYVDLLHATEHDFGYRLVVGGPLTAHPQTAYHARQAPSFQGRRLTVVLSSLHSGRRGAVWSSLDASRWLCR